MQRNPSPHRISSKSPSKSWGSKARTPSRSAWRPFSAVPDLLRRVREAGLQVAVASSAKKDELGKYLDIAGITDLVHVTTSAET
jgi:phosphoglycolate phosphatase-like HAD superfamily hydrolase